MFATNRFTQLEKMQTPNSTQLYNADINWADSAKLIFEPSA
jgi:hypothetical protein